MDVSKFSILLVDDEVDVLEFLSYNLKKEGFKVLTATNGKEAVKKAVAELPQLIILDVMMPEMDGVATCEEIKQIPELKNTLVIFLTARGEDYSQIAGFEAGADDYVTKPIKPKLLISRVKALLRRYQDKNDSTPDQLEVKDFVIDSERFIVINKGNEIILPKKEFELLRLLASKPNKVFTREEIFSKIWGDNVIVGDRTIDVHVRKIREKIGIENITTVKGVGYKFEV
ncbi:MAG TPA: response regulator transcription factor [Bacteroidales bacterium]|jgi:two-component system alkaline phosphatase synthesis response regulator PhoP|nr:response regulator transcription factor [Bacteroidales bacterium]MDD4374357.1 response regulator transcription factor [Bacteroidales bacterium]MDY0086156.1 response regulator transcription factor [Bacteroidales bacterium]HOI33375.1 response regulator transcription factor [Bacteroidales bacterium]HPE43712.1 response regulator transcription factor [Bacteroidales bacterium]